MNNHPLRKFVPDVFQNQLLNQAVSVRRNRPARGNRQEIIMGIHLAKTKDKQSGELTLLHQNTVDKKITNSIQKGRPIISDSGPARFEGFFDPILDNLPIPGNKRWSPICKRERFRISTINEYLQPFGPEETVPTLITFEGPVPEFPEEHYAKNTRWYLEINPLHIAESCFNVNFTVVPGIARSPLNPPADFIEVIANVTDPLFKKVKNLFNIMVKGALVYLVPANSSIRMIEVEKAPNFLLLKSFRRSLIHLYACCPEIEEGREDRAKTLEREGVTRENIYPLLKNFFVSWLARKPPNQLNFSLLGVESVHVLPICSTVKQRMMSGSPNEAVTSNSPTLKRRFWDNIWAGIDECLLSCKELIENHFQTSSDYFKYPHSAWKVIMRRVRISYDTYQSVFDPQGYINQKLIPVVEQHLKLRNLKGKRSRNPKQQDKEDFSNLIETCSRDGEQCKKDAERLYPDEKKKWEVLSKLYTQCYNQLQLARKKVNTLVAEEERKFRIKYRRDMPINQKKALKKRTGNRLISQVKKDYPLTVKIPKHMYPDKSDEDYSELYADSAILEEYPDHFSKPSLFVLLVTLIIEEQYFTLKTNELLFGLMRLLGISPSPSPWDNIKETSE